MLEATMTVRLSQAEKSLIADYAQLVGMNSSQFMRQCVLEKIENEIDVAAYQKAKAEYDANPVSYDLDQVEEMLGL